nr:hypothetical protein [Bacteroidota bacterium]
MKTIWVDLLCWSSAIKVLFLLSRMPVKQVYYINVVKSFSPFVRVFEKILKIPLIWANQLAEGDEKIGDCSLYELIQLRLTETLNKFVDQKELKQQILKYANREGFSPIKFSEHLKESAYFHLFKTIEMGVLSDKISGEKNSYLLFRRSFLVKLIAEQFGELRTGFYTSIFSHRLEIKRRKNYFFDIGNHRYYSDRFHLVLDLFVFLSKSLVRGALSYLFKKQGIRKEEGDANIGVELIR